MVNPSPFIHLEKTIGVRFKDKDLLLQSLIHRSAVRESSAHGNNERLEFLGDAVLELATTEYLYQLSQKSEGELTNWRSALVQGQHLAEVAKELKLGEYLFMSRGEEASDGRHKTSTLANAVEALIGAIYLDQGFEVAKEFCEKFILRNLQDLLAKGKHRDEKSVFQEQAQEKFGITPHYEVMEEVGPDHDKKFTCAVFIGEEKIALGKGNSKQRAEQAAAKAGLKAKKWS
ncbi:ribonuclease III [Candidatus Peribacteria bacterium RIFCSPHIGHO2_02_FULL_52_16]|nr:MAG: ribonuclease III [Candidatus Peribacteria bacterium RIFCSPHIGHO2_01_FULL_51_35]OGJ60810.1 MAG: ribonuclease III [Candidatus Peribacteria bacterium RIFCSPHIGHO2_02_FULL_52_16]